MLFFIGINFLVIYYHHRQPINNCFANKGKLGLTRIIFYDIISMYANILL